MSASQSLEKDSQRGKLSAMEASQSWHDYLLHLKLWEMSTSIPEDRKAPYVLLYGINKSHPEEVRSAMLLDNDLWRRNKDPQYSNPNDLKKQELIRRYTPFERLTQYLGEQFRDNKPIYSARRYGDLNRFNRQANESISDGVTRFKDILTMVRMDGNQPSDEQLINNLYIGLNLTQNQDLSLRGHFNINKAGADGNTYQKLVHTLDDLFSPTTSKRGAKVVKDPKKHQYDADGDAVMAMYAKGLSKGKKKGKNDAYKKFQKSKGKGNDGNKPDYHQPPAKKGNQKGGQGGGGNKKLFVKKYNNAGKCYFAEVEAEEETQS